MPLGSERNLTYTFSLCGQPHCVLVYYPFLVSKQMRTTQDQCQTMHKITKKKKNYLHKLDPVEVIIKNVLVA